MRSQNRLFVRALSVFFIASLWAPVATAGPRLRHGRFLGRESAHPAPGVPNTEYQTIGFKIPGAVYNIAVDINNAGVVGGVYDDAEGREFTFIWRNGQIETIAYPGAAITNAGVITNTGLLFGNWGSETEQTAGWYDLTTGVWVALPSFPGKPINLGWHINDAGTAVGQACAGTFYVLDKCVAWIWDAGGYHTFSVSTAAETVPQGINDRGQVVGLWLETPPFGYRAFLYDHGTVTPLVVNGGVSAVAYDISSPGRVMILADLDPSDYFRPALYERGSTTPLPLYPGATQTLYVGTNDRGDIVGFALYEDFSTTAVISLRKNAQ
jgi:uncharacterized membrane protein